MATLKPVSDVSAGTWLSNAASLYEAVDETAADDADFIYASEPGTAVLGLQTTTDPGTDTGFTINYRAVSDGKARSLRVALKESTTLIAEETLDYVPTTETSYAFNITSGDMAAVTDFTALRLELEYYEQYYSLLQPKAGTPETTGYVYPDTAHTVFDFGGYTWQVDGEPADSVNNTAFDGSNNAYMVDYLKVSAKWQRIRFYVEQGTAYLNDNATEAERRCELDSKVLLATATDYWLARQVVLEDYGDAAAMTGLDSTFHQIHAGTGSPAVSLRLSPTYEIKLCTTGTTGGNNVVRYTSAAKARGTPIDIVYRVKLSTSTNADGELTLYIDGTSVYSATGLYIGNGVTNNAYAKEGIYASQGLGSPATYPNSTFAIQMANIIQPQTTSLLATRAVTPATWPQDLRDQTGCPTVHATATWNNSANALTGIPTMPTHSAASNHYIVGVVSIDEASVPTIDAGSEAGWQILAYLAETTTVTAAIVAYASAGVLQQVGGPLTGPTLNFGTIQQASSIFKTIIKSTAPSIAYAQAAVAFGVDGANPPVLDIGSEQAALWLAFASVDNGQVGRTPTAGPAGFGNFAAQTSANTNGAATAVADYRETMQSINPGQFTHAGATTVGTTIAIY